MQQTYIVVMSLSPGQVAEPILRSGDPAVVSACVRAIMSRINAVQVLEGKAKTDDSDSQDEPGTDRNGSV